MTNFTLAKRLFFCSDILKCITLFPICHSVLIHIRQKYCPKLLYEEEWPREIYHSSMMCKKKFAGLEKENWKLFPLLLSCSSFQMAGTELFGKQWRGEEIFQIRASWHKSSLSHNQTGKNYRWEHKNSWEVELLMGTQKIFGRLNYRLYKETIFMGPRYTWGPNNGSGCLSLGDIFEKLSRSWIYPHRT